MLPPPGASDITILRSSPLNPATGPSRTEVETAQQPWPTSSSIPQTGTTSSPQRGVLCSTPPAVGLPGSRQRADGPRGTTEVEGHSECCLLPRDRELDPYGFRLSHRHDDGRVDLRHTHGARPHDACGKRSTARSRSGLGEDQQPTRSVRDASGRFIPKSVESVDHGGDNGGAGTDDQAQDSGEVLLDLARARMMTYFALASLPPALLRVTPVGRPEAGQGLQRSDALRLLERDSATDDLRRGVGGSAGERTIRSQNGLDMLPSRIPVESPLPRIADDGDRQVSDTR